MKNTYYSDHCKQGFSLVELMVVIAVIAILCATAIPTVRYWLPDYRLKTAARDLYSRLQQAKIQAARTNSECLLLFNSVNNTYQLVSGGTDGVYNGVNDVVMQTCLLSGYGSGVRFGNGNAPLRIGGAPFVVGDAPWDQALGDYIVFDSKGMLFETGYVYLTNDAGTCYAVGTPTLAGSIDLMKYYVNGGWE